MRNIRCSFIFPYLGWEETDIFTKMILIWSELLFRKSWLMTTVSERFKISYFKISKVNLFLHDLDTYVIQDGWNINSHDFLAMHDSTWYSSASNFHINLSQKRQEFVPSHMFHWQGIESQHCIHICICTSRKLKLILLLGQISFQRIYLLPTWVHFLSCRVLSLCICLSHKHYPLNHDCG